MKNLIDEIEKALQDTEKLYRHTSEVYNGYLKSHYRGKMEAYMNILESLKDYNIITAPKQIKLSEIVEKLKNNYSYDNITIERNSTYTRIIGRTQHHLYSTTETLFDINFNKTLDKPNFKYKWLYTLWISGTEIVDDLECDE